MNVVFDCDKNITIIGCLTKIKNLNSINSIVFGEVGTLGQGRAGAFVSPSRYKRKFNVKLR